MAQALVIIGAIALVGLIAFLTVANVLREGITIPVIFSAVLVVLLLFAVFSALGSPPNDD